ncbi:MAG TPA: DUF4139 domain-containing protein [Bacteroidia bacterium]|nr:DUF4139 domain-containing protein [Bacteroidia bacterium]
MKKLLFVAAVILAQPVFATSEKPVKSAIKKVTVFTQGAQVFRSSSVSLTPGTTNLVFSGVSPKINSASIQAGGKGDFVILDVKYNIRYPELPGKQGGLPPEVTRQIAVMEDSLTELAFRKDDINDRRSALQLEKNMIINNKITKGEGKSDSLPVLRQAMELFRIKLNDINLQLANMKREELRNNASYTRVAARLTELKAYKESEVTDEKYEPVNQVIVTVSADQPVTGLVEISYMVTDAGWVPSYDLRSVTASDPIQVTYKANIYQRSGEDWNNVKLKLSTSNPNRSNIKPILPPWYINYYTGYRESKIPTMARPQSKDNLVTLSSTDEVDLEKKMKEMTPAQSAENYSQLVETMTNVEFEINLAYDVPSDGINHVVSVKTSDLPATYVHYLVPKLESEAFLLARITGWEGLNLLPGSANIFYEGTYIGTTVLNPSVINDTLDLALGRDNGITVTRTKLPGKESSKFLGSEVTKTIVYELRMKNNKSKGIHLIVEDQIPLSQNKEIKIALQDKDKADYNEQTGLLKWDFNLGTKEYKSLKFSFQVTHNKDMPLSMY